MSKQTSAEWLSAVRQLWHKREQILPAMVEEYGDLRAEEATAMALSNPMFEMARAEEREKVLAELRSETAEEFARRELEHLHEECDPMGVVDRAIKIAKQEGRDEGIRKGIGIGHEAVRGYRGPTADELYDVGRSVGQERANAELEALKGRLDDTLKLLNQAQAERDHAVEVAKAALLAEWRAEDVEKDLNLQRVEVANIDDPHIEELECWYAGDVAEALARARAQGAASGIDSSAVIEMIESYRDDFAKTRDNAALVDKKCNGLMDYVISSLANFQEWVKQEAARCGRAQEAAELGREGRE